MNRLLASILAVHFLGACTTTLQAEPTPYDQCVEEISGDLSPQETQRAIWRCQEEFGL
jgi:hypothetical protein